MRILKRLIVISYFLSLFNVLSSYAQEPPWVDYKTHITLASRIEAETNATIPKLHQLFSFTISDPQWVGSTLEVRRPLTTLHKELYYQSAQSPQLLKRWDELGLPHPGWTELGRLVSTRSVARDVWLIWFVPNGSRPLSLERERAQGVIEVLRAQVHPDDTIMFVVGGRAAKVISDPQKASNVEPKKLVDTDAFKELHQAHSTQRSKQTKSMISTSTINAMWESLNDRLETAPPPSSSFYQDFPDVLQLIPRVKLMIFADKIEEDESVKSTIMQSVGQTGHRFYGAHFLWISGDSKGVAPAFLEQTRTYFKRRPVVISMNRLSEELLAIQRDYDRVALLTPLTEISAYHSVFTTKSWEARARHNSGHMSQLSLPLSIEHFVESEQDRFRNHFDSLRVMIKKEVSSGNSSLIARTVIFTLWGFSIVWMLFLYRKQKIGGHSKKGYNSVILGSKGSQLKFNNPAIDPNDPTTKPVPQKISKNQAIPPPLSGSDQPSVQSPTDQEKQLSSDPPLDTNPSVKRDFNFNKHEPEPSLSEPQLSPHRTVPISKTTSQSTDQSRQGSTPVSIPPASIATDAHTGPKLASTNEESDAELPWMNSGGAPWIEIDPPTQKMKPLAALYATRGPMRYKIFYVYSRTSNVGRSTSCACALPPQGEQADMMISREHFELSQQGGGWQVRCLSQNGLYVNQTLLKRGESERLVEGDKIRLGKSTLAFRPSPTKG